MAEHVNFYENLAEAQMRLLRTMVMYDGKPYYVLAITNHKPDGIFRMYLDSIVFNAAGQAPALGEPGGFQMNMFNPTHHSQQLGTALDEYMTLNPNRKILRKHMNSPLFNKYRPFPLGMINFKTEVYYLERQPQRHREQGLTKAMVTETHLAMVPQPPQDALYRVNMYSAAFEACVQGNHPSAAEVLENFKDPSVSNKGVTFHRHFALLRGPCGMVFLAYKQDTIGVLPRGDFSELRMGLKFAHCKEVVEELGLFPNIITDPRSTLRPAPQPRMVA